MSFKKWKDLILGVLMMLLSVFYLYYAEHIKTRPKMIPSYSSARIVPSLLGILLAALSVILVISAIKKLRAPYHDDAKANTKMQRDDLISVTLTIAVIIAYTVLLRPLGFCLATVLYLFVQMIVLAPKAKRNYLLFAIVSILFTALVFVAFRMGLQQMLPRGVIEALLGF